MRILSRNVSRADLLQILAEIFLTKFCAARHGIAAAAEKVCVNFVLVITENATH